ncbi:unnamed protein product [Camellia sinensis]
MAVGCIFGEMVRHRCMLMGTPNEETWPRVTSLFPCLSEIIQSPPQNYGGGTDKINDLDHQSETCGRAYEPNWTESNWIDLAEEVPGLEPAGVDLLSKMLCLDTRKRITARDALKHAYFRDIQKPP